MKTRQRTLLIFLAIFFILVLKEAVPRFQDPDPFYHGMMAEIIRDQGIIKQFPWFAFTEWPNMYVDQHLLYHILLIPFITVFGLIVGMKMSAIVFAMIALYTLYRVLKAIKAPYPDILTFAAALCAPFLYRVAFARTVSLSVTMLLIITWATLAKKRKIAFTASALFVWLYHGYPTALLSVFAIIVANYVSNRLVPSERTLWWQTAWPVVLGLLTGIIVNPTFPDNIAFSVLDIFKIGVVGMAGSDVIPGNEWFGVMIGQIAESSAPVVLIFFLSILAFVGASFSKHIQLTHEKTRTLFAFLFLGLGYTLLTIRSNRFIEYAIPFLTLSAGAFLVVVKPYLEEKVFPVIRLWFQQHGHLKKLSVTFLTVTVFAMAGNEIIVEHKTDYYSAQQYQFASDWIIQNVPEGEIVFTNVWDFGSVLVYLDPSHRVMVGLDPRFMSDPFPTEYDLWQAIIKGDSNKLSEITDTFQSRVVVVDMRPASAELFATQLESSVQFREVGRNEWVRLFTCLPDCGSPVSPSRTPVSY